MPLGSLRPSPLVEQATAHLREQIAEGHWPVGTRLPGETTLAASLGVGRSTVREAVRALAGAGLLRTRQGAGVFVIATQPVEDWSEKLSRAAVTDVYEVRAMLEVQAAALAAERRTDADIAALHTALAARQAAAALDTGAFVDADIALHAAIVAAAHNPVLADLFTEFTPALREGLIRLVELLGLRDLDHSPGDASHAAMVTAIAAADPERAGRAVRDELDRTSALLRESAALPPG